MQSTVATRRSKKQGVQPSNCHFVRGLPRTSPRKKTASTSTPCPTCTSPRKNLPPPSPVSSTSPMLATSVPFLSETPASEIQDQHEEVLNYDNDQVEGYIDDGHQEEDQEYQEEDQDYEIQQDEEHHEGNDATPNADGKIPIGVADLIFDFVPRKAAFAKLSEIIYGHFNGPWHCITMVPNEVKTMWFTEFEKYFCWTVPHATMSEVFTYQAGRHLSNVLKPYFQQGR